MLVWFDQSPRRVKSGRCSRDDTCAREAMTEPPPFKPEYFERADDAADAAFYAAPRLVAHLDDAARAALADWYAKLLAPGAAVLDLMSSCVSHLPDDIALGPVTGLGMNAVELAANPQLDAALVHDLNARPVLPFADGAFDACLVAVSVQYLTQPVAVFAEIARVLRPDGVCAVSFSNRCFPTKAVALWQAFGDAEHVWLVQEYFRRSGGFGEAVFENLSPNASLTGDPLFGVAARRA
ncbi:MAG: methyltransferase domain-containing protein [Alphaproteobacteria bacterium]|jgi:SAM-dependent methyltransferase